MNIKEQQELELNQIAIAKNIASREIYEGQIFEDTVSEEDPDEGGA